MAKFIPFNEQHVDTAGRPTGSSTVRHILASTIYSVTETGPSTCMVHYGHAHGLYIRVGQPARAVLNMIVNAA